jgi:hypothetical protein
VIRVIPTFLLALLSTSLLAQTCPTTADSEQGRAAADPSVLHGRLVYHEDLRDWLGLELDKPACGQHEIQLVFTDAAVWRKAEALRGCSLTVTGKIFDSPTGYYSAGLAVSDPTLRPDSSCHPFPAKPDLSTVPIPSSVDLYHVSITVDYRGRGHVSVHVSDGQNAATSLEPWQAYAHYMLTGGADVIWFGCQKEFQLEQVAQKPPGNAILPQDDDAGASLRNMEGSNTVTYSCRRRQNSH